MTDNRRRYRRYSTAQRWQADVTDKLAITRFGSVDSVEQAGPSHMGEPLLFGRLEAHRQRSSHITEDSQALGE